MGINGRGCQGVEQLERENAELRAEVARLARDNSEQCDAIDMLRARATKQGVSVAAKRALELARQYVAEGDGWDSPRLRACLERAMTYGACDRCLGKGHETYFGSPQCRECRGSGDSSNPAPYVPCGLHARNPNGQCDAHELSPLEVDAVLDVALGDEIASATKAVA